MWQGALIALVLAAPATAAVGVRSLSVATAERAEPLAVTLWYPAGPGGAPEWVGASRVFTGVPASRNAPVAAGAFPVVLISHGGLRAAPNQGGWIAADLAGRGAIVAAVAPPRPASAREAVAETWLRAADLSAALNAIDADPALAPHAAPGGRAVVGFFLGGTAGLALAGARLDPVRFAASCDAPAQGPDCAWFATAGVDLHAVDATRLGRDARDPRIGSVVAIDPELTAAFSPDSLAGIEARVALIGLGDPGTAGPGLDATVLLPAATYATLPGATPFSAMATCTPAGAEILAADGEDDAICREGPAAREKVHRRLAAMIAEALDLR